eukprot:2571211-Pyramimonas_sp.AAC.1
MLGVAVVDCGWTTLSAHVRSESISMEVDQRALLARSDCVRMVFEARMIRQMAEASTSRCKAISRSRWEVCAAALAASSGGANESGR